MFSVQTFIIAALLTELVVGDSSSGGGSSGSFKFDIGTKSGLTRLYNSPVISAERVRRPLGNRRHAVGILSHTGVVATLEDGSKWLVHKGNGYGDSSPTIVEKASNMSPRWRVRQTKNFAGTKTVGDMVRDGGSRYRLASDNCHHASRRMMKSKKPKKP